MLDGTWIPVAAELDGQPLAAESLRNMKLFLVGNKYVARVGIVTDQGEVKLGSGTKPGTMDITGTGGPNEGKTIRAIYELSGDRLTVCYALDGRARPQDFRTSTDSHQYLVTYQRAYP